MNYLKNLWLQAPLQFVLLTGGIIRLLAVFFSRGYAMHDDHFLMIEAAQSWVDGFDYNNWLPWSEGNEGPSGHSMFYVGMHYFFFLFCEWVGISSPESKMFFVRLVHGAYSLLIPYFTYKIALRFDDKRTAGIIALVVAVLWPLPMFSVRNLVEMVCIPPIMAGIYLLVRKEQLNFKDVLLAGFIAGLAVSIRIQTIMFIGGMGLALWVNKEFLKGIYLGIAAFVAIFLTQITDLFTWGYPFAEFAEYLFYNVENSTTYFVEPWYKFILVVLGIIVPPLSLFFLAGTVYFLLKKENGKVGFGKWWQRGVYVFLPMMAFFIMHCIYPNKQERFILPFIPFFLITGVLGWKKIKEDFVLSTAILKIERFSWRFFFVLNIPVMLVFALTGTKLPRVDSMTYLSKQADATYFLIENSHSDSYIMPPDFYFGKWNKSTFIFPDYTKESLDKKLEKYGFEGYPNYLVFFESENLDARLKRFEEITRERYHLVYVAKPSLQDKIFYMLNPKYNKNEAAKVYKRIQ